jgi:DNA-binding MarR family transcriptional regulator
VDDAISIKLNRAQVSHVLHQARGETGIAAVLNGLADNDKLAQAYDSIDDAPKLSRSLLTGLFVLRCFPEDGSSLGVKEVADIVGRKPSNTFRYMTTLVAAGLLERDPTTRRYHLPARQLEVEDPEEEGTA